MGGKKAFPNDYALVEFSASRLQLNITIAMTGSRWYSTLLQDLNAMLAIESTDRPSAAELRITFTLNRTIALAEACLESRQYQKALDAFAIALELGALDCIAWKHLGDVYKALQNYSDSVVAYEMAIQTGFSHSSIFADKAYVLQASGNSEAAIQMYKKALPTDQTGKLEWRTALGDIYMLPGDFGNAISEYRKATSINPDPLLFERLSRAYLQKQDIDSAMKVCLAGLKRQQTQLLMDCLRSVSEAQNARSKRFTLATRGCLL